MGNNLFAADIAGKIAKALGPKLLSVKLTSVTPGTPTDGSLTSGANPTTKTAVGRGIIDSYEQSQIDGTVVQTGDKRVLILGDTLPSGRVPASGDRVEIEGSTYNVVAVERDPDAAAYTCQVRG